ncbi:hypothetical protein ACFWAP_00925 [Streptomyces goshikiensis]|uniref:hypothetical protein n=1 Tax=Streptomyces goshikiensis TaxID=1942 RepID=UPI00364EBD09
MSSFASKAGTQEEYAKDLQEYLEGVAGQAELAIRELVNTAVGQGLWDANILALRVLSDRVLRAVADRIHHIADQCADYDDPVIDDAGDDLQVVRDMLHLVMVTMGHADMGSDAAQSEQIASPQVRAAKMDAFRRLLDRDTQGGGEQ